MKNHYVICIDNAGYDASLEKKKLYHCIPDAAASRHNQVRIVDESGEDYLYPESLFAVIEIPEALDEVLSKVA